jgi:hypothetical protein
LFFGLFSSRRKGARQELRLERLEVKNLKIDVENENISYDFSVTFRPASERVVLAFNKELRVEDVSSSHGLRRRFSRVATEKDLGWAQVRILGVLLRKDAVGERVEIKGHVWGSPEDFTLSRLGVRFGRAVLKDELIWHPVIGMNLVSWAMRGRVESYSIEAVKVEGRRIIAPGSEDERDDSIEFDGRALLREPGVSVVVGDFRASERGGETYYTLYSARSSLEDAEEALSISNSLWDEASSLLGAGRHSYRKVVVAWNDVDPFVSHDLVVLRDRAVKGVRSRDPNSLYEVAYLVSSHVLSGTYLKDISDYWIYEALQHLTALYLLEGVGAEGVVEEVLSSFRKCMDVNLKKFKSLPPLASIVGVPKDMRRRVTIQCKGPLVLWGVSKFGGTGAVRRLLRCLIEERGYDIDVLRQCLEKALGGEAGEFYERYVRGGEVP